MPFRESRRSGLLELRGVRRSSAREAASEPAKTPNSIAFGPHWRGRIDRFSQAAEAGASLLECFQTRRDRIAKRVSRSSFHTISTSPFWMYRKMCCNSGRSQRLPEAYSLCTRSQPAFSSASIWPLGCCSSVDHGSSNCSVVPQRNAPCLRKCDCRQQFAFKGALG